MPSLSGHSVPSLKDHPIMVRPNFSPTGGSGMIMMKGFRTITSVSGPFPQIGTGFMDCPSFITGAVNMDAVLPNQNDRTGTRGR